MLNSVILSDVASEICRTEGFDFQGEIGHGGFKKTFRVMNQSTPLALKIYISSALSERTDREISAMTRCSHHGIARVFDINRIHFNGTEYLYIVEEFIGGGTLSSYLSGHRFNYDDLLAFGNQMIDIIEYVAGLNLIHRDIKPDNILFRDAQLQVVLTDFGIVRDLNQVSLTPTFFMSGPGTPGFAAPEQINNQKPLENWRTDQFSCGIVLSLCAFGINPFGVDQQAAHQAITSFGNPTSEFLANSQSSFYGTIKKMVEVWPVKRFRTIEELRLSWNNMGS